MKKVLALLICVALCATCLCSCAVKDDGAKIRIGVLNGPTGMGLAKLICDTPQDSKEYQFSIYSDPNAAVGDLSSKTLDMLCLPTNTAAKLAAVQPDYITVIALNCLGSLYLVSKNTTAITSMKDLEGKTVYTSVPGSTTEPILRHLLRKHNVNADVQVLPTHDALVTELGKGSVDYAVLPEPKVSAALLKNKNYTVSLNLSEEWSGACDSPLTMGCIVVRNEFLRAHTGAVNRFLDGFSSSVQYITDSAHEDAAQKIVDAGILPALPVAKNALSNLRTSLVAIEGKDMREALNAFYTVLSEDSAASIGGKLPSDAFYYAR